MNFLAWLVQIIIKTIAEFIWGKSEKAIKDAEAEKQAKAIDKKNSDGALSDLKKPIDTTKSVEEQNKEAENAWDNFFNRFKR